MSTLITHQPVDEFSHDRRVGMGRREFDLSPNYFRCGGSRETARVLNFTPR